MLGMFRACERGSERGYIAQKTNQTILGIAGKKTQTSSVIAEG